MSDPNKIEQITHKIARHCGQLWIAVPMGNEPGASQMLIVGLLREGEPAVTVRMSSTQYNGLPSIIFKPQ